MAGQTITTEEAKEKSVDEVFEILSAGRDGLTQSEAEDRVLTGESLPVEKQVSDVGYAGSIAKQSEMTAVVVSTGLNTFFGKTARLAEEAVTVSHFQKAVIKIGDYLIVLAIALVSITFIVSIVRHEDLLNTLQFALVLIVAAIPAAMPAVLSITMAVGAVALARKEAIVSKLVAIEEMAGVDVLCSDKTGTITENSLTLSDVVPFGGAGKRTCCWTPSSHPGRRTRTPSTWRSSPPGRPAACRKRPPRSASSISSPSTRSSSAPRPPSRMRTENASGWQRVHRR
ncbi:HAD-IC family P-type ATPase [Methanofollis sp. UBA420]|jgi:magnesium-transporting ATPase (P-type)|uniref:HAD-IC family P-type ATPase n=1 Tax=Methanofollis sp. UBA420 TaxID=1915514 RepID=UPI00316AC6CD